MDQTQDITKKSAEPSETSAGPKMYPRFDLWQRISHIVMLTSFTVLAMTGLPQKFIDSPISLFILRGLGGIENTRAVHHVAAFFLMVVSVYHLIDLCYRIFVLHTPWSMMPWISDFKHLIQDLAYYLGLSKHHAFYGRFSYAEKVEYLALVWGTILMGLTGFMMWNPIAVARFLPGEAIPAAKAAHGAEAILAVLAIIIWHVYHVHIKLFNKSMFTGKLSEEEMKHEHPAELEAIHQGTTWQPPAKEIIRKRQRVFFPIAAVMTIVAGLGMVGFITAEKTAITTIPQGETAAIFVPLTPTPRPTLAPTPTVAVGAGINPNSWAGYFEGLFRNRCGTCHVHSAIGGLSLATYESALKGGNHGPGIVPGNPDASLLVQIQSAGNHPGQLSLDELNALIEWIKSGAPEK
jgi:cytochrome b subunit of formate dehydrogenase